MSESPRVTQERRTFSMSCGVAITIRATPETIWRLLTEAADFPRWNSTVESIEGEIREGQRVRLRVPDVDRVFRLKVSDVVANERMRWSDGFAPMFQGVRDFRLSPRGDGSTHFSMVERFSGLMLPMIKGSLPDFGPAFARYARDLKAEAERA